MENYLFNVPHIILVKYHRIKIEIHAQEHGLSTEYLESNSGFVIH